jgi:hypothetical protein
MSNNLNNISELLLALLNMREDLKLQKFTDSELALLAAMSELCKGGKQNVHIKELRSHRLIAQLPKPSVYNALKKLIKLQYCAHIGTERSGLYRLEKNPF